MSYIKICAIILVSIQAVLTKNCHTINNQIESPLPIRQENLGQTVPDPIPQIPRPRNRCCPYDFDSNLCRIVDDRVLCGYNLNVGQPKSKNNRIDLSGGCRLRGGRLECGYEFPPFANSRRPPAWNDHPEDSQEDAVNEPIKDKGDESGDMYDDKKKLKLIVKLSTQKHRSAVTRCVEIRERIVCKDM